MRSTVAALLLSALAFCKAECSAMMELPIDMATKLSFSGFDPAITRIVNTGVGNKIVLKSFEFEPVIEYFGETMSVTAGASCAEVVPVETEAPSSASKLLNYAPLLFGLRYGGVTGSISIALTAAFMGKSVMADKVSVLACDLVPIEVEIYVDTAVNDLVMKDVKSGSFDICPPETLYWKHHKSVFGGYEGCVGEKGFYPCPQDSQGVWEEGGDLAAKYPLVWDGSECIETGYQMENRTFWILWGDPLDKYELNLRTGFNPVVTFPFNRGPYPRYERGVDIGTAIDDSSDARAMAKDLLLYIEAFTENELEEFDVTMTEGAESGMVVLWAAKALEIAQTTCNRDIYALMEVPAYGYNPGDSARIANRFADSFYNSTECLCFEDDSCKDPTVTVSNVGWLPLTPLPVKMGGDGEMYAADSTSAASPWFESMVFPENPSGKIKTPQISDPNRRVCDGVYLWPMYFGMRDYVIPIDERPDCSSWSFSITKAYSASVRAGFIIYKEDPITNHDAMVSAVGDLYSMTHGLYSEWSWLGQMQLWEMIMSRELTDPTSWIGAYSEIMDEKWEVVMDGFADCPVLDLSNPKAGAYAYFVYKEPYLGVQTGFVSSFFRDVLGIRTTTYNWGFRGANPADFYGEGYTTADFTRLQLYRDVEIYKEVARRAKIVCADLDASIGDFISINQWVAGEGATSRRRLSEGYADIEERKRDLKAAVRNLSDRQLDYLAKSHEESDKMDRAAESCAPYYHTTCLFDKIGSRFEDF